MKKQALFHAALCLVLFSAVCLGAEKEGKFTVSLFTGATLPVSPDARYGDVYSTGPTFGLQYRHMLDRNVAIVGEIAYNNFNNFGPNLVEFLGSTEWSILESQGGDLKRYRLSGGIAVGMQPAPKVHVYGKTLVGVYRQSAQDLVMSLRNLRTGEIRSEFRPGVIRNDFGMNFGGAVEYHAGEILGLFGGFDVDVMWGRATFPGGVGALTNDATLADITFKGGIIYSY